MIRYSNTPWRDVPTVWIDTETTGTRPGVDRVVQIGVCRIERGEVTGFFSSLVDPGIPIPAEASAVHGITDDDVRGKPRIEDVFATSTMRHLLEGAQPGGYNCRFDQLFLAPFVDWQWPWIDTLTAVRVVDRYVKGKGRHTLSASAARHGVELPDAHSAFADAKAAGELFYKLAPDVYGADETLGELLFQQRILEAQEWARFNRYRADNPRTQENGNG